MIILVISAKLPYATCGGFSQIAHEYKYIQGGKKKSDTAKPIKLLLKYTLD